MCFIIATELLVLDEKLGCRMLKHVGNHVHGFAHGRPEKLEQLMMESKH